MRGVPTQTPPALKLNVTQPGTFFNFSKPGSLGIKLKASITTYYTVKCKLAKIRCWCTNGTDSIYSQAQLAFILEHLLGKSALLPQSPASSGLGHLLPACKT